MAVVPGQKYEFFISNIWLGDRGQPHREEKVESRVHVSLFWGHHQLQHCQCVSN